MYKSKRKPRAKQAEALKASEGADVFAFLMAMRTGKTKVTVDDFGRLEDAKKVDDLLIIAPAGVYKTWQGAIADDWPDELLGRAAIHVWESGTYGTKKKPHKKRMRELDQFLAHRSGPRVLILNVEALSTVDAARKLAISFCRDRKIYCAIDESTIIKNPGAERTKFIVKTLAPLTYVRRILSGLPTPRSPLDLYSQFAFLDKAILGFDTYKTFQFRYAIMQLMESGGRRFEVAVGYRNVEELHGKIAPFSFRCTLEDCYDLPPSEWIFRDVELSDEQRKAYREIKEYATAELALDVHVTATSVITQMLKLHQVLMGHVTDEMGIVRYLPEKRTASLVEFLEEYTGKAIIWCSYDIDIRKVSAALTKEFGEGSVARFWGGNKKTREQEELLFKSNPSCRFMVATPDAGGKGRTWDVANLVIYYSCKNDLEHRSQSEERPKGVGKDVPICYVDMRAPGTVEEKFIKALREKIDMSTIINGDNYREWII